MKNKILSLVFIGIFTLFFPYYINVSAMTKMQCGYTGTIPGNEKYGTPDVNVLVTIKLTGEKGGTSEFSSSLILNGSHPLVEQLLVNDGSEDYTNVSKACSAGKDYNDCIKKIVNFGCTHSLGLPGFNYSTKEQCNTEKYAQLKLTFGLEETENGNGIVKVLSTDSNGKYVIETNKDTITKSFVSNNKYTCPSSLVMLTKNSKSETIKFNYTIFYDKNGFSESKCDSGTHMINEHLCTSDWAETFTKTETLISPTVETTYDGGTISTSGKNCCVYYDSKDSTSPVYVYSYDNEFGKKQYAACVGVNCMTLSPTANHNLTSESTNSTSWSEFHNLDDCSKMPSKIWFTYKNKVYERSLTTSITCEAPDTEKSNINKTYEKAVIHPTKKSAQDLIDKGENNGSNNDYEGIDWGDKVELDCDGIFGDELLDFIGDIFKWIRILAPIAVILLSSVEFAGALLQDDRDALKKASNRFVKRLIIAVALFFVPLILEFILNIFNEISKANTDICIGK